MARGGKRKGRPGAGYGNRTDLVAQPVKTGPSQQYGQAAAQQRAQQAIPLPQQAPPPMPVDLFAPTQRPDEPVTAGLTQRPMAMPASNMPSDPSLPSPMDAERSPARQILVDLYKQFPYPELLDLIERI